MDMEKSESAKEKKRDRNRQKKWQNEIKFVWHLILQPSGLKVQIVTRTFT